MNSTVFRSFLNNKRVYAPSDLPGLLRQLQITGKPVYHGSKEGYINIPAAFDIETTSFELPDGTKQACMYVWQFGLAGAVIMGRTWDEFIDFIEDLSKALRLNLHRRLIVYVHNLAYEFQFLRKHFEWESLFALKSRSPLYAVTTGGIEFRCSYLLSGYGLAKLGEELQEYKVEKLVGDLDYSLHRHCKTPLTPAEIQYCANDVRVVMAFIAEEIQRAKDNIAAIPYTKTGYVRNYVRENCFYEEGKPHAKSVKRRRYTDVIKRLILDPNEYKQLKRAFQGGFTHANPFYVGKVVENVESKDFTSSYPTVMLAEMFPMSEAEQVPNITREEFEKSLKCYCCLFDAEINGLRSKIFFDSYISKSRCTTIEKPIINNGRVVSADRIITTVTELDWQIICKCYDWDSFRVANFRRYYKWYLPRDFILAIIKLYTDKTQFKGFKGKEAEYMLAKGMLNACYGMTVTDIVRDKITYTDDWSEEPADATKDIPKYNDSRKRFLFYPWGVWVTAYARRNLWTGILECKGDYVYSDTDSIKIVNSDRHKAYFDAYNKAIMMQLEKMCDWYHIDKSLLRPKTIKGVEKPLGVWDDDGSYQKFKTLGAKRYMVVDESGELNITVSGVNKTTAVPYLLEKYGKNGAFGAFTNMLYIPKGRTGKLIHTYIDEPCDGIMVDYLGNAGEYHELSFIHLSEADYSLSISQEFADYIAGFKSLY